jgi:glycosyltransferase involved in cell wall biosynthesis
MRIGIDARFLTHPQKGGFKTYTENLVVALSEIDQGNEYILYVDRQPSREAKLFERPNFTFQVIPGDNPGYGMFWREQYKLPQHAKKDKLDVFHAPCLTSPLWMDIPLVVTIHDMIWYYPSRYTKGKFLLNKRKFMQWYYRMVPAYAIQKADAIITVSHSSKQSIIDYLRIEDEKIFVTHEAPAAIYHPVESNGKMNLVREKYGLTRNFILAVGSTDPRKNINTLLKAFALLPESLREQYQLVIVWNHKLLESTTLKAAKQQGISDQILFLRNVEDEDLALIYNLATLFVFPSLEEGFGLPPLEAMACGTPVLAADNSSLPEIVGDAALQFSAENVGELTKLISNVLINPELQHNMKERGIGRAACFSWKKCGMETIDVYKKTIS